MNSILKLDSLTKKYHNRAVVDNLSFDIMEGDLYGFLGPNGAGKTTTLSMLLGLIKPDFGTFRIFNKPEEQLKDIKKEIGALIEFPAFYDHLSAEKNLSLFLKFYDNLPKNHINDLLEIVDLTKFSKTKVGHFSQGMKQRLWIAQSMIGNPRFLILDEPTNGLDPEGNYDIWKVLKNFVNEKKSTILISSHLLNEIEEGCNKVCIISEGKKIASGYVSDLLRDITSGIEIIIENSETDKVLNFFKKFKNITIDKINKTSEGLYLTLSNNNDNDPAKINYDLNIAGFRVRSFHLLKKSLKEYFLDIITNSKERKQFNEKQKNIIR